MKNKIKNTTSEKDKNVLFSSKLLRKYEAFYRDITKYAALKIWIVNKEGRCIYLNDKWYDFTGQIPGYGTEEHWIQAIHPDDRKRISTLSEENNQKREPFRVNYRLADKDEHYRWHEAIGQPKYDGNGNFSGYIGFLIDIHEEKKHEKEFAKNKNWFKMYADAMPQMAFVADAEGNIIYYNKRWHEYVKNPEDTKGWDWKNQRIHHPGDLERTLVKWKKSLATGKPYEIEYRLKRHDGKYRWHLGRAMPLFDNKGNINRWLGTNTDIHKQKTAENRLARANQKLTNQNTKLKQMRQLRENLLHIIGHDLRGPVGNMQLALELHDSIHDEKGKNEILDGLRKMVEKQKKVISGLTEL
ncbi:MAG TPA: PAS domain S-box protein, partial [Prolixibacteraceae bacterium]|nr:PAS domain S-box protein [Prolixibacteraceae bacterium]